MKSYILQAITAPTGASYAVSVYSALGQILYNYHIGALPCLYTTYNVKELTTFSSNQYSIIAQEKIYQVSKLNFLKSDQYSAISQELIYNVNELNTQRKSCMEEISCLVNYTITKQ
jgi:hypothetical protein